MRLEKGILLKMPNGFSGIDVRVSTDFASWNMKAEMKVEAPIRVQGGRFQCLNIGAFSYFNDNAYIRAVRKIGRFCAIGPNVQLGLPEHSVNSLSPHIIFPNQDARWTYGFTNYATDNPIIKDINKAQVEELKKPMIEVGNDVWIGANAIVMRGVKIGNGAIIAAGAVVTQDVKPYEVVGGIPAKHIKYRFSEEVIEKLQTLEWWNYGPDIIKGIDISNITHTISLLEERIKQRPLKYAGGEMIFNNEKKSVSILNSRGEKFSQYLLF